MRYNETMKNLAVDMIHDPVEIPISLLGRIDPEEAAKKNEKRILREEETINGVILPQHVLEELKRLGIAASWYSAAELQEAIRACHYDRQLIDDPAGVHYRDQLHLSNHEKVADSMDEHSFARARVKTAKHGPHCHGIHPPRPESKKELQINSLYQQRIISC